MYMYKYIYIYIYIYIHRDAYINDSLWDAEAPSGSGSGCR